MNTIKGRFNQNIILEVARPLYLTKFHDEKHSWKHIRRVRKDFVAFINDHDIEEDEQNILFTALIFHDCNMRNRKKHHEKSADLFMKLVGEQRFLEVKGDFDKDDIEFTQTWLELHSDFIYQCIFEHRSSVNSKHKTELGYITSLLDFGYPFPYERALDKAVRRGISIVKEDYEESGMIFELEDNFDYILHEADVWFRKRWLNLKTPRDITKEEQKELLAKYRKNTLAKTLVDMLYD